MDKRTKKKTNKKAQKRKKRGMCVCLFVCGSVLGEGCVAAGHTTTFSPTNLPVGGGSWQTGSGWLDGWQVAYHSVH